jgi:hypothetical protein
MTNGVEIGFSGRVAVAAPLPKSGIRTHAVENYIADSRSVKPFL